MTNKQKRFLSEIVNYIKRENCPPTIKELKDIMNLKSPRSVGQYLESLEKLGCIKRGEGARNIRVIREISDVEEVRKTVEVPIVGVVACGVPLLAQENIEGHVDVSDKIARRPHNYFILKAKGDSMNLAGIDDGDLLLVRQQPTAQNGEIVVALIDDDATVKRLKIFDDYIKLEPESKNPDNKSIILERDFQIQGVVVKAL